MFFTIQGDTDEEEKKHEIDIKLTLNEFIKNISVEVFSKTRYKYATIEGY